MYWQARLPPALGAVHNFIRIHDPGEINEFRLEDFDRGTIDNRGGMGLAAGPAGIAERDRADVRRDGIAQAMWVDYQALLHERAMDPTTCCV
jgi:hypothetical protein